MSKQSEIDLKELTKISLLLSEFSDLHPGLTVQQAQSVIAVALNEGASMSELAQITGIPTSTMSRHLLDLGPENRLRKPGLGLVNSEIDPYELRKKSYTLSSKGTQFIAKLLRIARI